ncbi:MAG: restriction endonuclease [Muribaculaceae bacterium]|nr:restriction endonuclease [Muribaculaceae bacterium]
MNKKVSPQAIGALENALSVVYWYKKDLKKFLYRVLDGYTEILSVINWDDTKRNIVVRVIDMLERNGERTFPILLQLICTVSDFADFSHLERLEDGKKKKNQAQQAVNSLRRHVIGFQHLQGEVEKIKERREINQKRQMELNRSKHSLAELKDEFYYWSTSSDLQGRGYALEKILYKIFELYDLDPKASFKGVGEQLDGAFSFNNEQYLLEAKWRNKPTPLADLYAFSMKIERRLENTLGLFISISGFSKEAIDGFAQSGKKLMLLMDCDDLLAVLDERITICDLLLRKRREAAQTGNIYFTYRNMMS